MYVWPGNDELARRARARASKVAEYIAETGCTVRQAAEVFEVGKSTIYRDLTRRVDGELAERVRQVLDRNREQRAARGGLARHPKKSEASP